jgi:hypothetical protein
VRRSRERRIIAGVLRCYPERWRSRHGDEATEMASALLDDGTPWWSIAGSFLGGVAKERARRKLSVRVGSALVAIAVGIVAVPLAMFATLTPANASGIDVTVLISPHGNAVQQLESAFAAHHFKITISQLPVSAVRVGSILAVSTTSASGNNTGAIGEIHGQCNGGGTGCVVGLVLPLHYSGTARVTVGAATTARDVRHNSQSSTYEQTVIRSAH